MNRRGFLALLAGAVLDPERLLWVPGRKVISIPAKIPPPTAHLYRELSDWQRMLLDSILYGNIKVELPRQWGKSMASVELLRLRPNIIVLPPVTGLDAHILEGEP